MDKKAEELLVKIRELIKEEGIANMSRIEDREQLINEFILPALDRSKDIQKDLYSDFTHQSSGLLSKVKRTIITKLANITRNVVEKSFMRQQKFNNNTKLLLEHLVEENKMLRDKIEKIEQNG
ncbi:hypothetical protein KC909_00215 [Candidatus Dojkabacteria bacterium]|uniref:Uncharacterized protein n=1 Tax=Candidatus Dojkabacteria bacterium TaxID=2099670 RepID=A0A955RII8_9BACT|nr:hypothetical protein [Candidatus Dojkabacteria bacterium]